MSSILLLAACGKGSSGANFKVNDLSQSSLDPNMEVTYAKIKSEILQPHCLSCHSDVSTQKGLSKWVSPGKPNSSPLFTEVENGNMPKNQSPLGTKSLELIKIYIEQQKTSTSTGSTTGTNSTGSTTGSTSTGSGTGNISTGTNGISFDEVKAKVLGPYRCTSCHSVGTEAKLANWINKSSPTKSSFYTTIKSGSMPQGGPKASDEIQAYVLQYIKDFASR